MEDFEEIENEVDTGFNGIDATLMPRLENISIITLNNTRSNYYLDNNVYEKQRGVSKRRLDELKRKANDGRFHGGEIAVARLNFEYIVDGKIYKELLMNGQHQCMLVQDTGKEQRTTLKVFTLEKPEQLPVLFAQFDQPGGVRSAGQIAQAYSELLPGWPQKAITACAGAIGWIAQGRFTGGIAVATKHDMTIDERIEMMLSEKYLSHAEWAYKLVWQDNGQHEYPHMPRQPVLASMIRSHMKDSVKAEEFWPVVKTGANLQNGSPQLALRHWLQSVSIGNTSGGEQRKKKVSSAEVSEGCDKAFDAYLDGHTFNRLHLSRKGKRKTKAGV